MVGTIYQSQLNGETCVEWKIDNFLKTQDVAITSPEFQHMYYRMQLWIYPWGVHWFTNMDENCLSMSLKVLNIFSNMPNIEYTMGIKVMISTQLSRDKTQLIKFIFDKYDSKIFRLDSSVHSASTPVHEIDVWKQGRRNYLDVDDSLTVVCNIRCEKQKNDVNASPTHLIYDIQGTASDTGALIENFKCLYYSKRFADITITVKNEKQFRAHKLILSARSEVFASMFQHDTSESRSGVINISDCDPDSFEDFLLYLYTGKLNTASSSNAASLYKTADKYGVEELKNKCIQLMFQSMTVDSFCKIFHLAALHGESDLLNTATVFFIRNAKAILMKTEWLALLEEHASLCNELLVKFAESTLHI